MKVSPGFKSAFLPPFLPQATGYRRVLTASATFFFLTGLATSQPVDCGKLAAEIRALEVAAQRPSNHFGSGVQNQRAELDRLIGSGRALGCNRAQFFMFEALPPQCQGINARIAQLQSSLARYGNGDSNSAVKQQLTARYNAYCQGQSASSPPPQRNFFDALLGVFTQPFTPQGATPPQPHFEEVLPQPGEDALPHGGSQVVCVRSCDGGFFPINLSANESDPDQLAGLCQALCPNADVNVYTRSPYSDISTAVSLSEGVFYSELPNALKFQKTFDPACTCKPPGQTWAEALAGAEDWLGRARKSDILVTPETSAELAKPKSDLGRSNATPHTDINAEKENAMPAAAPQTAEVVGPDGVKRRVRIIVPPL